MKKLLSAFVVLLSAAIIAILSPIICTANAESLAATKGSCGNHATWTIVDGTLTISGTGAVDDYKKDAAPWYGAMGKIEKVVINEGITRLGANAFNNSNTIKKVIFPNSLEEIGASAFYSSKIENPILPPNLKVIEERAFAWCWEITEITIPDSVTSIGKECFSCCVGLAKVKLPVSLTKCEEGILENTDIATIVVPDGVTTLGKQCFASNYKLTEIHLPATVVVINDQAFDGCDKLANVHFAGTKNQALSISIGKTNACLTSATWHCSDNDRAELSSLSGGCGNHATWTIVDGTLTISGTGAVDDYKKDAAPWYSAMGKIEKVVINEGITRLGANAFNNSNTIKKVIFPNSLEEIGASAFYSSKIENPILPPNLKVIEERAFAWCWEITEITIPDSVTSIGKECFSCCVGLAKVKLPTSLTKCEEGILENTDITTIVVPDGVTTLGKQCFASNYKLTEIYLPATVIAINDQAFDGCNKLANVHFAGTKNQALSISIGKTNACLTSASWHYNDNAVADISNVSDARNVNATAEKDTGTSNATTNGIFAFEDARYSVMLNKTITLKPVAQNISGALTYTWGTSDENVVTVSNGQVKGKSSGEAVITCTAADKKGNTYTATCVVQVIVPITSIKADKSSIELAPGSGRGYSSFRQPEDDKSYSVYKPVLTFVPADATNKTLEWSSENISVATVDANGTIYGRGAGTTRIVGKATDGSGQKVYITVTVPKFFVTSKDIKITEPEGVTLGYAYASVNGISVYNMKISGDAITTKSLGEENGLSTLKLIPVKAGNATLTFTRNGNTIGTVKVKVERTAIYDSISYPPVKISTLLASPDTSLGTKTQARLQIAEVRQGKYGSTGVQTGTYSGDYTGVIYGFVEEDGRRQYVAFEHEQAMLLEVGSKYIIFGKVSDFIQYTTETGLVYDCPYFTGCHIGNSGKPVSDIEMYVVITNTNANIRSGPDGSATKIASAYQGDSFPLLGEEGNWYKIEVNGQVAYVSKGLCKIKE